MTSSLVTEKSEVSKAASYTWTHFGELQQIQQPKSESKDKRLLCSKTSWGVEEKECKAALVHILRQNMFALEF